MDTGLNDETIDNQIKKIQWAIDYIMGGEPCTCNNPTILCEYCEAVTVLRIIAEQKIKNLKEGVDLCKCPTCEEDFSNGIHPNHCKKCGRLINV